MWTWEQWQWRGTLHSPKLQRYLNLTVRLFSVISRTLVAGVLQPPMQRSSRCILQSKPTGQAFVMAQIAYVCKYTVPHIIYWAHIKKNANYNVQKYISKKGKFWFHFCCILKTPCEFLMQNPMYIYIYIYIERERERVKLANLIEGDSKAPFSISTTPRCRGGRHSIHWIAPPYLWSLPYNAGC